KNADAQRWALLPALVATLREREGHPGGTRSVAEVRKLSYGAEALRAANAIADRLQKRPFSGGHELLEFARTAQWAPMLRASEYAAGPQSRRMLMLAVGLGWGRFDLVIIDEAQKSRGDYSRLSVLLREMLHPDERMRIVAMSATPVEIEP